MTKKSLALLLLLLPLLLAAQSIDTMWVRHFERQGGLVTGSYYNLGNDILADEAGYVHMCGQLWEPNSSSPGDKFGHARYNQWGDFLTWALASGYQYQQAGHKMVLDDDSRTWVLGQRGWHPPNGLDALFWGKDTNWATTQVKAFMWEEDNVFYDMAFGPNGELYLCGTCWDTLTGYPGELFNMYVVCRYDTAAQDTVWTRKYVFDPLADYQGGLGRKLEQHFQKRGQDRHPDFYDDFDDWDNCATAIYVTDAGEVFTTGFGYHRNREYQVWTMRHDPVGNLEWSRDWGRTTTDFDDVGFDIVVTDNGYAFIAGFCERDNPAYDYLVMRYQWNASTPNYYHQDGWEGEDFAYALCLDDAEPIQNVYVTGAVEYELDCYQMVTHKFTEGFARRWGNSNTGAIFGAQGEDAFAYDICWNDGLVYVTGQDSNNVMATVCYTDDDAVGVPKDSVWSHHYSRPDHNIEDVGCAIWADDSDHVYVTGQSSQTQNGFSTSSAPIIRYFWPDRDLRVDTILAPSDTLLAGTLVTPEGRVINEGNDRALSDVHFWMEHGWTDSIIYSETFNVLAYVYPGDTLDVDFAEWTPQYPGSVAVRCSVAYTGDNDTSNDVFYDTVFVVTHDVGAMRLVEPTSTQDSGSVLVPQVWMRNYGNVPETFDAYLHIEPDYFDTASVTVAANDSALQGFATWTADDRGSWAITCSTMLDGDAQDANDSLVAEVFVRVADLEAVQIIEPSGPYQTNDVVYPEAKWTNNGNVAADFEAWMILEDPNIDARAYAEKLDVTGLAAGADTTLDQFPSYQFTTMGYWTCICSTGYADDMIEDNDTLEHGFLVGGHPDIAVETVHAPSGSVDTSEAVVPRVTIHNHGDVSIPFSVWFVVGDPSDAEVYREELALSGLTVGADTTLRFPEWAGSTIQGDYLGTCSLDIADEHPENDMLSRPFEVEGQISWPAGWQEMTSMPLEPSGRTVKRGGWLAVLDGAVYAGKGYKTQDFYRYNPLSDSWTTLGPLPYGEKSGRQREAKKGSRGVSDGEGHIFYTAGNNTLTFAKYFASLDSWAMLPDVPEGPTRKQVKGGNDMAHVVIDDTGWVYLMKGYKTEFYRFNTVTNAWDTLPDVPASRGKMKRGSWLAYDGMNYLYVHEANYYNRTPPEAHYMYRYDIAKDSWATVGGMPLYGLHSGRVRKKKSKDGGSAVWYDDEILALKGGNTQQFWKYTPGADSWVELDTVPNNGSTGRKRRVKYGADLVEEYNALWALKGNKTSEFWRYGFGTGEFFGYRPGRTGVQAERAATPNLGFAVRPNPLAQGGVLHYTVPYPVNLDAELFDATGRRVMVAARDRTVDGRGALRLDTRGLAAGVYLLRVDAHEAGVHRLKVVIE